MAEERPIIYRKFVLTDLVDNHNKEWHVLLWPNGDIETRWGRVGETLGVKRKPGNGAGSLEVNSLVNAKRNKGYNEVILADQELLQRNNKRLPAAYSNDPAENLAADILEDANESIKMYLDAPLDTLSQMQIAAARDQLDTAFREFNAGKLDKREYKINRMNLFYKSIPTKIDRVPDIDYMIERFYSNPDFHYKRLDQLESAVQSAITQNSGGTALQQLGSGISIAKMDHQDPRFAVALKSVQDTGGYSYSVEDIYLVKIDRERAAFEAETRGKSNVKVMFHGTDSGRVASILRGGLRVPNSYVNGWRLGPGLYFADKFQRSAAYTHGNKRKIMLMVQVALGKPYPTERELHVKEPPTGYDSVWGQKTFSGLGDEFVVYQTSQQSIVSMLVLKK